MGKIRLEVVDDGEPDPAVERLLDYMSALGKAADTCYAYIGNPRAPE